MKKVTVFCLASDRDETLARLQDLGVLHLVPFTPPAGEDLDAARRHLARAVLSLQALEGAAATTPGAPASAETLTAPQALVDDVAALLEQRRRLDEEEQALHQEQRRIEPFGDFDPARLRALANAGIRVRLFRESTRQPLACPEGVERTVLHESGATRCVALIGRGDFDVRGDEFHPSERSLGALRQRLAAIAGEREALSARLHEHAGHRNALQQWTDSLRDQIRLLEARAGMGTTTALAYLHGFAPADGTAAIQAAASTHGWGLLIEDPAPTDAVPTLIRLSRWLRPIQSLFNMINILPGYREVDVSASFLLFLALFFALIVDDGGYGIVFLLLTLWMRRKKPKAAPEPFQLMYLFSAVTIVVGVLTGTYFGLTELALPVPCLRTISAWLNQSNNMMHLCLLIGAVHLTVAHAWNGARVINTLQCLAQAGWIGLTWMLFAVAETMLLGAPFHRWVGWMGAGSILAILVFMTPPAKLKTDWINHAMLPLSVMSGFGDILSYLRLFALGVAGVQLAMAFDTIAATVGFHSIGRAIGASVVLLLGHGLNIILGAMSVLVHGIRLNALEFSMHMGLEWSGSPYKPFARQAQRLPP
ncbi:MAG: hypothetical protein K8T26_01770 [Lentisphaerae bacterium]|nr:hypothetical protein [Lentisphaerota bacterium]